MTNDTYSKGSPEPLHHHHHKIVCWKSIVAGLFIAVMTYMLLTALGAGIGA